MIWDLMPPKLVKIAADALAEPLNCIINSASTKIIFPSKAKKKLLHQLIKEKNINIHFQTIDHNCTEHIFQNY